MKTWKIAVLTAAIIISTGAGSQAQWVPTNGPYCGGSVDFLTTRGENLIAGITAPPVSRPNLVPAGIFLSTDHGTSWKEVLRCSPETRFTSVVSSGRYALVGTIHSIYRSTDGGLTWIEPDTSLTRLWITALAAMTSRGKDRLFMATRDAGVYLSTDEGESWWQSGSRFAIRGAHALAVSGAVVFAATDTGVLASTDYGNSWHKAGLDYINVDRLSASADGTVYSSNFYGLFYSTDRGENWMVANNPARTRPPVLFSAKGRRVYASAGQFLYVSADRGKTWKNVGRTNRRVTSLVADGRYLFAGTAMYGVYRSTDSGVTWRPADKGLLKAGVLHLASGGADIYAGTKGFGVYKSIDGGKRWKKSAFDENTGYSPVNFVTALRARGADVCASTWGGLFYSTNAGKTWRRSSILGRYGRGFAAPLAHCDTIVYAGNQQTLIRSTDRGKSWSLADSGLGLSGNRPPAPGSRNLWKVFQTSRIGTRGSRFPAAVNQYAVPQRRFSGIARPRVIREVQAVACDGGKIYAGVTGGCVYVSTDKGGTWSELDSNITTTYFNQITHVDSTLYALTEGDGVFRSEDGGKSWVKVNAGFTDFDSHVLVHKGSDLFVGAGNGVYYSGDRGNHWTLFNTGLTDTVIIGLTVHGGYLYAGTWDYGVWKRKISEIVGAARSKQVSGGVR